MAHIFISCARDEEHISKKLDRDLLKHGFQTWRDTWNKTPSRTFHTEIKESICKASHFIVCLTEWIDHRPENMEQLEIAYALAEDQKRQHQDPVRRLPIIPLVFPGGELPPIVQSWTPIHIRDNVMDQRGMDDLLERLRLSVSDPDQKIPPRLVRYLDALRDDNVWRRWKGVKELGWIGDPLAIPALTYVFHDVNKESKRWSDEMYVVPDAAAWALEQIGPAAIPSLLVALRDKDSSWAAASLMRIGAPSVPGLLDALREGDKPARIGAAWALGEIKDPRATQDLFDALSDSDKDVRNTTICALGLIGEPRAIPGLLEVLLDKDNDRQVRRKAAFALGEIKEPNAVSGLLSILQNEGEDRVALQLAAYALGKIGDNSAVSELIFALKSGYIELRTGAAAALGSIGDPVAIPDLLEALQDPNEVVAWVAASSLGDIGDASAVPGLLVALKLKKNPVRKPIARSLGKIGDTTAVPGLRRALFDRDRSVRKAARAALAQIRK